MSDKFEIKDSQGVITFTIPKEEVKEGLDVTFNRVKKNLSAPGFRKGHMPRKIFNRMYGEESLYEDTLNHVVPMAYQRALEDIEEAHRFVGQPDLEVVSMDKNSDWEMKATVALKPTVKLGDYKDLEVEKVDTEVTEEDVDEALEQLREEFTELVLKADDQKAEEGDTVVIDFEGTVDGELFDGGAAKNHSLELGSQSFIPGFEEQLVGAKSGDELDVEVTFPESYPSEELAGKDAVFAVKVHEVKEKQLPELDDDFAMDADEDVDTLEELREKTRENLIDAKEQAAKEEIENAALEQALENAEMDEVPEVMIEEEANNQLQLYLSQFQNQGIDPAQFLELTGQTEADLLEQFRGQAETSVAMNLLMEAIVEEEEFTATDEEIDAEIEKLATQHNLDAKEVKNIVSRDMLEHDITMRKAIDLVAGSADPVLETQAEEEETEADDE